MGQWGWGEGGKEGGYVGREERKKKRSGCV